MEQTCEIQLDTFTQNSFSENNGLARPVPFRGGIFSKSELVDIFPEARATVARLVKEDEVVIDEHTAVLADIKSHLSSKVPMAQIDITAMLVYTLWRTDFIEHNRPNNSGFKIGERVADRLERNKRLLALYDIKNKKNKTKFDDFQLRVEKARQFSLTNLIEVNRVGFAKCPFHAEKTPSFKVDKKKNLWYCFSCHEGGDVISFVRKINSCSFKEAIMKLS